MQLIALNAFHTAKKSRNYFMFITSQFFPIKWLIFVARGAVVYWSIDRVTLLRSSDWSVKGKLASDWSIVTRAPGVTK